MSMYRNPEEHAANPPSSWRVVRVHGGAWHLVDTGGTVLASCRRKREAEEYRDGWASALYAMEARWYAGEPVPGWRPYAPA